MKASLNKSFQKFERLLQEHPVLTTTFVLFIAALLIISRRPQAITNPQFWAEDGRFWYADAYNMNPLTSLFVTYGGYFVVIYRFFGSLSLLLPFRFVPLFFNVIALCFQLLPLALINSKRLKPIIPYKSLALVISFLYIANPNSTEVFLNLTNIQWHLGIAAFLVLIAQRSNKLRWKVFDIFVLIATGLAGPLVILLFPISFLLWFKHRGRYQERNLVILGVLSVFQGLGIFIVSGYQRVGSQSYASLAKFIKMIDGQVLTGGILAII